MDTTPNNSIAVNPGLRLYLSDVHMDAMRASGSGGQNVNKVSSAIHLRFDVKKARLPESVRERLLASSDSRLTAEGVLILKAQRFRTQGKNRDDALARLLEILRDASVVQKTRRKTKPSRAAKERRLKKKDISSKNKKLRKKPSLDS